MTSFWSYWIIILTTITIVGITWILLANRKGTAREPGEETTGHNYDGIEELDNPLPAWWFYMFLATIIFSIGYLIVYPGMGNFKGLLGWTQVGQYETKVEEADAKFRHMRDQYLALPIAEIANDPVVVKMGQRMFANNCAQCHGADAKGRYGFPNLTDNDWLYGGSATEIKTTLTGGRRAVMPAWGEIIKEQGIKEATAYILSLNGLEGDAADIAAGETVYKTYCVACHLPDASGTKAMGAPNLANGIWLYGGNPEQISHTLRNGRNGVMPAFKDTLTEDKIHILSAYVYSLNLSQ
jgi:cytochrome c oxidase cbb3-type subunit 3